MNNNHNDNNQKQNVIEGTIAISGKGIGFVRTENFKDSIEIDPAFLNTALHGDRVKVAIQSKNRFGRYTGEILEILIRSKVGFAGTLQIKNGIYFLKAQDPKMYTDIIIPNDKLGGSKEGQKVFATITLWDDPKKNPEGEIIKVLGTPNENNAEMLAIALEKGFDTGFPRLAEEESIVLKKQGIDENEIKNRKDFRNTTTFTIDPEDAKDFDDAISFKELSGGRFEIGVHIADVSHYVTPKSNLDKEAAKRTTSVYLVDRTIPMLPEIISNDLCSLNPNEDKLAFSAVFEVDMSGNVSKEWYGRAIINSDKRFSYEDAQKVLDDKSGTFFRELETLNTIAKTLKDKRFKEGAISLEQEEVKFILDGNGKPLTVYKKVRGDTHKLIEEFMLLANRKVAEYVSKLHGEDNNVFVYRIHDEPNEDKISDLIIFLKNLGYSLKVKDGELSSKEINNLLVQLEGRAEKDLVQTAVVRSMAKAIYSTKNVGHYGLGFEYYTHFTSPIRRYPDVLVHRLLDKYLKGEKPDMKEWNYYEQMSRFSSQREKEAADAERSSIKYKQVEYMSERIGKEYEGIISGVTEWGIYVEEKETKCEGMVMLRTIGDDFYKFDEKNYRIVGERTGKKFTLGDTVKIKVMSADLLKKTIDYAFVK